MAGSGGYGIDKYCQKGSPISASCRLTWTGSPEKQGDHETDYYMYPS